MKIVEYIKSRISNCKTLTEPEIYGNVDLEKTHESYIHDNETVAEIITVKHFQCRGPLLKDSLYVEFLTNFKGRDSAEITDEEIRKTEYCRDALQCLSTIGHFRENKTESEIIAQCRYFLELYQAIKRNTYFTDQDKFVGVGINHSVEPHAKVIKISDPEYYLIYDGHHRLACQYVAGQRYVKARIIGKETAK